MAEKSSKQSVAVFWFRRDLRLDDNQGLPRALESGLPVLPLFIFDTTILSGLEDKEDARVTFIHRELHRLNSELESVGSALQVEVGRPLEVFSRLAKKYEIKKVFANRDYEPRAIDRDLSVAEVLRQHGAEFLDFKDQVIFEKTEVAKDDGKPYTVFTPYSRKWKSLVKASDFSERKSRSEGFMRSSRKEIPSLESLGFEPSLIEIPSREVSLQTIKNYEKTRDLPGIMGTSRLGVHLRFGTVSVRKLAKIAEKNSEIWLKELIWREFFMQILWNFPHVVEGPFRPEYAKVPFRHDEAEFEKWCRGETGYAIVDAGMRELNATGFMHNRVRMIAASFLVKHLLIDWRWGERYFARKLLDYELASNNGNWQWVAGTGCDAAPYFRVFNPEIQTKKFDPEKRYIRKWVPEFGSADEIPPMISHIDGRLRAIRAYSQALGKKAPEVTRRD